jgi:hypothetical protein
VIEKVEKIKEREKKKETVVVTDRGRGRRGRLTLTDRKYLYRVSHPDQWFVLGGCPVQMRVHIQITIFQ